MNIRKSEIIPKTQTNKNKKQEAIEKVIQKINDNPNDLTPGTKKLIKRVNNLLDEAWSETKKKPNFVKKINKNKKISLFPVYTTEKRIALQIEFPDEYKKITFDERATNFTYEKVVKTEHGTATTKSYNSKTSKPDAETIKLINELKSLPI